MLRGDGVQVLTDLIAPGSLAEVWLFFPDPWPKTKHFKRRLVTPEFAALVASRLRRGGSFRLATDWAPYAERMLAACTATKGLRNANAGLGAAPGLPAAHPVRAARAGRRARDLRPGVHPALTGRREPDAPVGAAAAQPRSTMAATGPPPSGP